LQKHELANAFSIAGIDGSGELGKKPAAREGDSHFSFCRQVVYLVKQHQYL